MMHTVIGAQQNNWEGPWGGVTADVGGAQKSYSTLTNGGAGSGLKTNWVFTDGVGTGWPAVRPPPMRTATD